jgi:hypothetical protein
MGPSVQAFRKALAKQFLVARDLDHRVGQTSALTTADADAVQSTRRRISLAFKLAARMERGENDLKR